MDQLELLKKVLRLPQHWRVVDVETDEETRQLTVSLHFVRTRRRLLGGEARACARCGQALPPTPASRYLTLRHLPLGDWQVNLRLPDSTTGCADRACPASAELAEPGTRVTHAFASRMVALHSGGASLATTAALLDVEVSDVAVVLAARGMPVDALTGEIALVDHVLRGDWDGEETDGPAAVDAMAIAASPASSAPELPEEPPAAAPSPTAPKPLPPIAASISDVELLPSAQGEAVGDSPPPPPLAADLPDSIEASVAPQPVPTDSLLAADEEEAQAAFDAAIEGETDALAQESIDEHTQTGATLIEELAPPEGDADAHADDGSAAAGGDEAIAAAAWSDGDRESVVPAAEGTAPTDAEQAVTGQDQAPTEQMAPDESTAQDVVADAAPTNAGEAEGPAFDEPATDADGHEEQASADTPIDELSPMAQVVDADADEDAAEGDGPVAAQAAEPQAPEDEGAPGEAEPTSTDGAAHGADADAPDVAAAREQDATADAPPGTAHPAVPVLPARAQVAELPPVEHPVWGALLSGEFNLETEALALQMLLARLRQFVRTSDDQSAVSAAARVLHKHLGQSAQRYAGERSQLLGAMDNVGASEREEAEPAAGVDGAASPEAQGAAASDATARTGSIPTLQPRATAPATLPVPPIDHPVWAQLVTGQRALDTTSVALRMMLEQIKRSAQGDASDATRMAGVRLLHTFFTKTSRQLTQELRQLHEGTDGGDAASSGTPPPTAVVEGGAPMEAVPVVQPRIPPETSPSWQALLDGRVVPSQEDPGLSMLMEKVRRVTSQGETSGEVMAAAARVLRRYLARYARRHVDLLAELNSLDLSTTTTQRTSRLSRTWRGANRRGAQATSVADVPPVEDPVWGRLMDGDLLLETDAFALRMMLERIRRSVRRDPSESNRQAAALQLRDYFVKHERVHRAELQRIRAA